MQNGEGDLVHVLDELLVFPVDRVQVGRLRRLPCGPMLFQELLPGLLRCLLRFLHCSGHGDTGVLTRRCHTANWRGEGVAGQGRYGGERR